MFSAREAGDKPRPTGHYGHSCVELSPFVVGAGLVPAQLASGKMKDAHKIRPQTGLVS
jgi:hypothetical protein